MLSRASSLEIHAPLSAILGARLLSGRSKRTVLGLAVLTQTIPTEREDFTMSNAKHAPKRKRGAKAVPVLGAAGLLSLAGGASAATSGAPVADLPTQTTSAESRNHPRRGRAFRRQPVDLLCLRQGERQVSAWRQGRLAWMRRLSVRRRLPVRRRLRLAWLRRLWLRRLWLLRVLGTLPHLLKGTLRSNPEHNKSPSQHCATGRGPTVLAVPTERGQLVFVPMLSAKSIAEAGTFPCLLPRQRFRLDPQHGADTGL